MRKGSNCSRSSGSSNNSWKRHCTMRPPLPSDQNKKRIIQLESILMTNKISLSYVKELLELYSVSLQIPEILPPSFFITSIYISFSLLTFFNHSRKKRRIFHSFSIYINQFILIIYFRVQKSVEYYESINDVRELQFKVKLQALMLLPQVATMMCPSPRR